MLYLEVDGRLFERPASTRVLRPLHGFEFVAEGEAIDEPAPGEPAQLWIFDPQEAGGTRLDGFTFRVRRMAVTWPDAPLRFEREWLDGERVIDLPAIVRGGATPADYHRLADAYQALSRFTENERTYLGGRPEGSLKGQRWDRDDFLEWYREASQGFASDGTRVTLDDLKEALGVRSDVTAKARLDRVGLPWPPESFPDAWEEGW